MIVSLIGNLLGWQASFTRINSITGELEKSVIAISNLLAVQKFVLL